MLLVNLIQQQKAMILNVVDQQESSQDQKQTNEGKLKLLLKPHSQKTKTKMKELKKNHLIMVTTSAEKKACSLFEYLATKQCMVDADHLVIRSGKRKIVVRDQNETW